jgi:hypothetical protein
MVGLIQQAKAAGRLSAEERLLLLREWSRAHHDCHRPPFFRKSFSRQWPRWQHLLWLSVRSLGRGHGLYRRLCSPPLDRPFDLLVKEIHWSKHLAAIVAALDPVLLTIIRHPCGVVASVLRGQRLGHLAVDDRDRWFEENQATCTQAGWTGQAVRRMTACEFLALDWLVQNLDYLRVMRSHPNSRSVAYQRLCTEPLATTAGIFDFLGWPMGRQTVAFIRRSSRPTVVDRLGFWRGKQSYFSVWKNSASAATSWRQELTARQIDEVLAVGSAYPHFGDCREGG